MIRSKVNIIGLFRIITRNVWLNILTIILVGIPIAILLIVFFAKVLFWFFSWIPMEHLWMIVNTNNYVFDLKDIVYFSITLIGVIATSVFSFFIWRANKKSAEITEKLAELEKSRDNAIIKESATLLYFTSLSGLEYIFDKYKNKTNISIPHLSSKWIDSLDKLYGYLLTEEIKMFFDLYSCISDVINISGSINEAEKIAFCIKTYFDPSCIEYTSIKYDLKKIEFNTPIALLKRGCCTIFNKLKVLIDFGEIDKSFNDTMRKETYKNGEKFCEIKYSSDEILYKKFWSLEGEVLEDCYYEDGKPTGYKKIYSKGVLVFDGSIKAGEKYTGQEYNILLRNSEGYDLEREEAVAERMLEEQSTEEYWDNQVAQVEDAMNDGRLQWEEFCKANWIEGKRILQTNEVHKEPVI